MSNSDSELFIYAIKDEESARGFIFVASENEIDVENTDEENVDVYHVHSVKNKPYNYTVNKKPTNVRLEEFMSVVDEELFKYNKKQRIVVFEKKGYDSLIAQLMDDLDEDKQSESESEDDKKKSKNKSAAKSSAKSKESETKTRGRRKKAQESESESYQADDDEDKDEKKTRGRGRPSKKQKDSDDEEEEEQEEKQKSTGKRGRPPAKQKKSASKKGKESDEEQEESEEVEKMEEEEEEEEEEKPKRGRKPAQKQETQSAKKQEPSSAKKQEPSSAKKEQPSKRGRKPNKAAESEENEVSEDGEEQSNKKGSQKKVEKFKKGECNPNITDVIKVDELFEGSSSEIQDNCCSFCTNKELLRAVYTGNHALLKKLVQSKSKISTLFAKRGPDSDDTILEIILKNKDKKALDIIIGALQNKKDLQFASNPTCSLDEVYTGYNDRFAYGAPTRKVNVSRGGKEGNNAFVADFNGFIETNNWHQNQKLIYSLLENETEVQFLEFLRGLKDEQLSNQIIERAYIAVRAGNRKTAAYLIEQSNKHGGHGFNKVHEQVLSLDNPAKMDEFKRVSATKKSTGIYTSSYHRGGAQGVITPIHCAAINPNPAFLKKLLDISPEITIPDDIMRKPVHYAATCEGPGPLSYLIKQGADTREGDKRKITPLMLACQFGRAKNVEVLLAANGQSNPDTRTREGMRALHFAALYGHIDCVKLMIETAKVDVDTPGPKRMTALHIAAAKGHQDIVEYLLTKEAKQSLKDKFKRSAVIHATANGQLKILSILLKNGGPFNDPDSSNNYPVHYAAAYGFQACLDLLYKAGADLNKQNQWNLTPLSVAMAKGHFGMVKKLLSYDECDVNCTDVEGRTIVSRAIEQLNLNNLSQFEFIIKDKKANPNMADLKGQSPLHYLCNLSENKYIKKRQEEERKYNITKKYQQEFEQIVEKAIKLLLDSGADINKQNTFEQSPFTIAIKQKNSFVIKILSKKAGIDYSFVNKIDQNIFHILGNLIVEGITGIEQFKSIFEEIKKYLNNKIKEYINKVDYHGFTPILSIVKIFSENALNYKNKRFEEIQKEMFEKKGGQIKVKKSNKKKISKYPILSGFKPDGTLVKLSESEIENAMKKAEEDLQNYEQEFLKLIEFLAGQGANIEAQVEKIRKYRSNMEIEDQNDQSDEDQRSDNESDQSNGSDNESQDEADEEESDAENEDENESEEEDEDIDDENSEKREKKLKNGDFKRDKFGNPRIKEKQKSKPHYNSYGKSNIFGIALSHPSQSFLKNIAQKYPQLIDNIDYLNRNHISNFIIQHTDFSKEKDKQNQTCNILEWLCTLKIDINSKDFIGSTPLITAIASNKFKFAQCLVKSKADVNVKDSFGKSPLIMAINSIKSNNLDFIEFLLSNGANPNLTDNYGRTSLHHAVNIAEKGANASFDLENLLMNSNADVNVKDSLGRSPLHYCFIGMNEIQYSDKQYDPFETVSSLCAQPDIQIDIKDIQGKTPLHYAAQKNSTTSAIFMIEKNASVNEQDNYGNTPLSIAFRFQRSEITTTFIQNKADTSKIINILKNHNENGEEIEEGSDDNNNYYGRKSRSKGYNRFQRFNGWQYRQRNNKANQKDLLQTLLSQYKLKKDPYNPLLKLKLAKEEVAAKNKDRLIFQEFREKGNLPVGKHSFFKAAITYEWQGIAYLLLIKSNYNLFNALEDAINIDLYQLSITLLSKYSKDKSIISTNLDGQNLLHILCKRPPKDINLQVKLFEKLLARNVDYKQQDKKKNYCLHYGNSHPELTTKLLDLGLDCNAYNENQNTPFSLAIQKNISKALKIYTEKYKPDYSKNFKAKPTGQDVELMFTPLVFQFANKNKDLHLLDTLLSSGSSINEVDSLGRTSLYYAIYHNSEKLVKFILQSKNLDIKHVDNNGKNPIHYVVNPVEFGSYENIEILELLKNSNFDLQVKDKDGNTPMYYALLQDTKKLAEALQGFGLEAPKDKKLPKRAATSIVASADFPEEEIDYEEDSKEFNNESAYDKYKEFFEQKNAGKKVQIDGYVSQIYKKSENYVVLDEDKQPYNLLMTKVDLSFSGFSKYVFYIMQIIFEKNTGVYILFTRWGQMGQMGQMQHTPFPTQEEAVKEFNKIFQQKSGNKWTERHDFKKKEKKYQLQTIILENDKRAYTVKSYDFQSLITKESQLDKPIQEFIKTISNSEIFKSAQKKICSINEDILPLTKLSRSVLIEALGILTDIRDETIKIASLRQKLTKENNMQRLLEKEQTILNLSNRYYELVPRTPSKWDPIYPLTSEDEINNEVNLVENLIDFETAIKIIMGSYTKLNIMHPLDYCFNSLSVRIKQIEFEHPESKMIHQYISRTNKKVLDPENKIIKNIFAVERRGEAERISQFKDYQKKLLWHGTGAQNILGIFSQGLRINSIGSEKSGSSLGEGVYFSDLYAKSSSYARNLDVGVKSRYILLCEVAVGKEYQIKKHEQYEKFSQQNHILQKGFNSIKLVGNECPDEKKNLFLPNGTIVPIGNIIDYNQDLKHKIRLQKAGHSTMKKRAAKKSKGGKTKAARKTITKRAAPFPKRAAVKRSVKVAVKRAVAPRIEDSSDSDSNSDDDDNDDNIENQEDSFQDENKDSNEDYNSDDQSNQSDKDENENDESEQEDNDDNDDKYNNYNNQLYGVPEQSKKIPFSNQLTEFIHSEYVVQNTAQVRIRYLIELNN